VQSALCAEAFCLSGVETLHRFADRAKESRRGHRIFALLAHERLALDQKGAPIGFGGAADFRRTILEGVLRVALPEPFRFHQVTIGIDDFKSITHSQFTS